ncbi:MAG: adenosylcobalamin-dependent ribonucleoside-diphosphate reductase [Synergistaceae bacterium]|jgi:ribonucleoside-diphosphate reductase alpha chain|nr:adenosylcobalamin-dependent ribonucleoside-diphosphate reductase [Synergistaceae bacterium]
MTRSLKERFNVHFPFGAFDTPSVPRLSENAMWLLEQRYFVSRYDEKSGTLRKERSFEEFTLRVARTIASAETLYLDASPVSLEWLQILEKNIASDILDRRFLFNSPCLFSAAAGLTVRPEFASILYKPVESMTFEDYSRLYEARTQSQQLFACFVINVPDSIEGIFESVKDASVISKFGGGVGGNFGWLREHGSAINGGTGGQASGPVSFMETWNTMGAVVVQGGKRRAALMGMLFDNHPDIFRFIDSKTEDGKLSYFNISVAVSDKLMEATAQDGDFDLISRDDGSVKRTIKAKKLMGHICESAWKRGDPGVFFIDKAQQDNLLKMSDEWTIESTNPCGEQPLPNYTSCNLGSINVEAFVESQNDDAVFDWAGFSDQVARSIYYLDLVIDACSYPLERIEERTKKIRPVGLGLMGLADAALMQDIVYGSPEFHTYCERLGSALSTGALLATAQIVSDAGKQSFPESHLVGNLFDVFRSQIEEGEEPRTRPLFSEGVIFSDEWFLLLSEEEYDQLLTRMQRSKIVPRTLVNTLLEFRKPDRGYSFEESKAILHSLVHGQMRNSRRLSVAPTGSISMIMDASSGIEPNFAWSWNRHIAKVDGSGTEMREFWHKFLSEEQRQEYKKTGRLSDKTFVTAYDITMEQHVDVMGIFARVVDSGISKTVNLPNNSSVEDVRHVYEACYRLGCKGITIYRDGSRSYQPIEIKKAGEAGEKEGSGRVKERPGLVVFGRTIKESTPWGSIYVTINFDGDEPFEIFITIGKSGSELKAMTEALSRAISIGLRSGSKLEDFIATLKGLSGKEYWMFGFDETHVARSIPDAIAVLLEKLVERDNAPAAPHEGGAPCPECKAPMEMISGCAYCFSCGYSPCK